MSYGNPLAQDAALDVYKTGTKMYLCSAEPTTYATAVSLALADMGTPSFGTTADYVGGRETEVAAITDGIGTATGTATHYAIVTVSGSVLQVVQSLSASFSVVNTEVVKTTAFKIQVPDPK